MTGIVQSIKRVDVTAYRWLMTRPNAARNAKVFRWVSRLGDGGPYALLGVLLALLDPLVGLSLLLYGIVAFAIELPLYWVLKNSIKRSRPSDVEGNGAFIVPSDEFSFPSGHTAAAFLMATILSVSYPSMYLAFYGTAGLIGASRVVLGVHYPTDILAGSLLGTVCAISALAFLA